MNQQTTTTASTPTWRRANRGEVATWVGVGAGAVLALEVMVALAFALTKVPW